MKQNGSAKVFKVLAIIFALLIVGSAVWLGYNYFNDRKEENDAKFLSTMIQEEPLVVDKNGHTLNVSSDEEGIIVQPTNKQRFSVLYEENNDFLGWISIPGTEINYPVMFTPNEPEKYIHLDFYGNKSKLGLPFMDAGCDAELGNSSSNWLIYGHNMKTTTMFSTLLKYKDKQYWDENPIIKFDTMERSMEFEIIGAFYSKIYTSEEEGFRYYDFKNAENITEYDDFVRNVKDNSLYETGITAEFGDQLLTLSTCSYHVTDGRFVVVARIKK